MKRSKPLLPFLASLLLAPTASPEVLERVVVKVNGDIVTQTEFTQRQVAAAQAAGVSPQQVAAFLRENNARILQEAIDDLLVIQRAGELGIRVPEEHLDGIIEEIKQENGVQSEEELLVQLRNEGMTLTDLKRSIERSILKRHVLMRELEEKSQVTDAEVIAEYDARRASDYSRPATVQLQEILLEGEGAQELAEELAARARAGEDFSTLASTYSASPSRDAGGDLGRLAEGEMNETLGQEAFALEPGGISDPLAMGDGYALLRLVDKTEASVVPYEDVKKEIRNRLSRTKMMAEYDTYVADLRQDAIVQYKVREVSMDVAVPEGPTPGTSAVASDPTGTTSFSVPGLDDEMSITGNDEAETVKPLALPGGMPPPPPLVPVEDEKP